MQNLYWFLPFNLRASLCLVDSGHHVVPLIPGAGLPEHPGWSILAPSLSGTFFKLLDLSRISGEDFRADFFKCNRREAEEGEPMSSQLRNRYLKNNSSVFREHHHRRYRDIIRRKRKGPSYEAINNVLMECAKELLGTVNWNVAIPPCTLSRFPQRNYETHN